MLPSPPSGSTAALYDYAEQQLGVYLNSAGNAWPELRESLFRILEDKVAPLAFVPNDWLADVRATCGTTYAPQLVSPYMRNGDPKPTAPAWLRADKSYLDAWHAIADLTRAAVLDYSQGKIEEGRAELAKAYAAAAFWDGLYRATKAVADLPSNAVAAVGDGVGYVAGGVFGSLAKSWVFWVLAVGAAAYAAWRLGVLKPLAQRAVAKAAPAKAGA